MIANLRHVFSISIIFLSFSMVGQSKYWEAATGIEKTDNIELQNLKKENYAIVSLKEDIFKNALLNAPLLIKNTKESSVIISLPNEKGVLVDFYVFEAPVLAPELSKKYPDIKSYVGYGINDKKIKTRFSVSPFGVQSMLKMTGGQTVFMEKNTRQGSNYIIYNSTSKTGEKSLVCNTVETKEERQQVEVSRNNNDQTLRRYRLAVSATGEYTTFHGGTVKGALAAINATITRVNEVFETDLGISLEVISTTDAVIYTDSNTDPYTGTFTSELQTTLTNTIGESNYDVGHLFHRAADNGNAGCIGCVCIDGRKGSGFSATTSPTGDTFDIDYVAHEIGHQFGANHTWSFETEGTGVNVEPASGTTIMAYAGITGRNNVLLNSEPYFHYLSILQIRNYVATTTCDVESSLSNQPPLAVAGNDYTIPKSTAFVLTGDGSDPDLGDILTYTWEQIDDGVVTNTTFGPINTTGANFRSLRPTETPVRYMPSIDRVLSGNLTQTNPTLNDAWETVSDVAREMNFSFVVRDNALGGGQTNSDQMRVTVIDDAGPFLVQSQTSAEVLIAGEVEIINWDVANTNIPPIDARKVDVLLSVDGGLSFPIVLAEGVPNDGEHSVIIPGGISTTNARIMVKGSNNIFFAVNSADLTIIQSEFVLNFDELEFAVCQPDDLIIQFDYNTFIGFNEEITFSATNLPAGLKVDFNPISTTSDVTNVEMRLSDTEQATPGIYTISIDASSTTASRSIEITLNISGNSFAPSVLNTPINAAEAVFLETTLNWNNDPLATEYDIQIATDAGFNTIIEELTILDNSYRVKGLQSETTYYWRIKPRNDCGEGIYSTSFSFTTVAINCKSFVANNLPVIIPSEGTPSISTRIRVPDDIPITDVKVTVDISHIFVSDLTLRLVSPQGTSVILVSSKCDRNDNIDATFDDAGDELICDIDPAISGIIAPAQALSSFFGESPFGEWTLIVEDGFDFDGGVINAFSLELCAGGEFITDTDADGIVDDEDNCKETSNADQADNDNDGIGDICDDDDDNDTILDSEDNCPFTANPDQADNDNDGIGDICDDDDDNDTILDSEDNCPFTANPDQLDTDNDGIGNVCDSDVLVSEAITPNGDGINDSWTITNIENHPSAYVSVYNRTGAKIFEARNYQNDWNGVYRDRSERLPAGSYYYQIDLEGNGSIDLRGWIYITY